MKLTKDKYDVSAETLIMVLDALQEHKLSEDWEDNNDDVIAASNALEAEIDTQQ